MQEAKHSDAVGCAHVDVAVGDGGFDELVSGAELISRARLVAVVDFTRQVRRIIGVQNGGAAVLRRPQNGVGGAIRGDAGRGTRITRSAADC